MSAKQHLLPLVTLHDEALVHLRRDDFRRALAPLCRLLLALHSGHAAEPGVRLTLAMVYRELDRPEDARRVLCRPVGQLHA